MAISTIWCYNARTPFTIERITPMKPETEELIKLINSADDSDRAALTAFAILLDYLKHRESPRGASDALHQEDPRTSRPA